MVQAIKTEAVSGFRPLKDDLAICGSITQAVKLVCLRERLDTGLAV
jgi:hypothetical protein